MPPLLKLLGGSGLGALKYSVSDSPPRAGNNQAYDLERLTSLALRFEQNMTLAEEDLAILFQAGSSPGGARPKVIITDNGVPCIAKFPSTKDQLDVVGLEAAVMSLAGTAGLEVPKTRLVHLGESKVLLVARFDVTAQGGRLHMASMQTLLGAEGFYSLGYSDIAGVVGRISGQPAPDLKSLYRQMVFNVLIGNTDDHLKNFLVLHDDKGWRLSPAFDLTPNIGRNREHVLHIGDSFLAPGKTVLLAEARKYGISRKAKALEIFDQVYQAVSGWRQAFAQCRVPAGDGEIIGRDIEERMRA